MCNESLTFESFCLKDLAACLVLKLIILTQEVLTEGTAKNSPSYSGSLQSQCRFFFNHDTHDKAFFLNKEVKSGGGVTYHDPTHRVHTQCSLHQSTDTHRHECSDISYHGTPRLHRSHILPPYGRKQNKLEKRKNLPFFCN